MKSKIFKVIISVLLVVVLTLQVAILIRLYGPLSERSNNEKNEIDVSVVNFETPYCTIKFPSAQMDYLKIEKKQTVNVYSAIFICELNGKSGELFTATFGVEDAENSIGSIQKNGETIPVSIKMAEIDKSLWTKEELKIVKEMQKGKSTVQESILSYKEII